MTATPVGYPGTASAKFLDGIAHGELRIRRCDRCGQVFAPQTQVCSTCEGAELSWTTAAGTGTVVTWMDPAGEVPGAIVAIVELDEGPWLHSLLDGVDPGAITPGMAVAVAYEQPGGGDAVPVFRPV